MTQEYYKECFDYNAETGELFWRERPRKHFKTDKSHKIFNRRYAHTSAGYANPIQHGRLAVNVGGKVRKAHRVIWEMVHGPIADGVQIDHVNGDPTDNRLCNLREATHSQNMINKRPQGVTGIKGVSTCSYTGRFRATIWMGGRMKCLGRYDTPEEAGRAYDAASLRYHGEFSYCARTTTSTPQPTPPSGSAEQVDRRQAD